MFFAAGSTQMSSAKVAPTVVTSATAVAGTGLFQAMGAQLAATVPANTVMYQAPREQRGTSFYAARTPSPVRRQSPGGR